MDGKNESNEAYVPRRDKLKLVLLKGEDVQRVPRRRVV
jgi:hypothetical protein